MRILLKFLKLFYMEFTFSYARLIRITFSKTILAILLKNLVILCIKGVKKFYEYFFRNFIILWAKDIQM